ncbi:uncharacterized protein LACBIDRAFT_304890 [Laccaria bicolor S238N-H82]|uniref:Predicted protein n=1 Tax=Laccaria bicolor (strain S238N-H82 / ATCC MYA-4686) TaxID=486041 RepID=B0DMK4_LACBS|nr:uncharacterized protein LACBIDRAFT_304890 [Laccaria bicolor S238N-H82]EDR04304.1 predicted protein [Laccaria bicolor S238N-H82]|eukprot:XP_001885195.1 predicted protein [Laccaria bicolor S238N-H82]
MLTVQTGLESAFFATIPSLHYHRNALEATLHNTEETSLVQVDRQYFVPTGRQRLS